MGFDKCRWAGLFLAFAVIATAGAAQARGRGADPVDDVLRELQQLRAEVRALEREASGRRVDGREMRQGLDRIDERLEHMEDRMRRLRRVEPPPPPPLPMDDASFAALRHQVRRMPFAADKLGVIGAAASMNLFAVPQVLALLDEVPHSDDRLQALRLLWPRVLDRQNGYRILGAFRFHRDRDLAARILAT